VFNSFFSQDFRNLKILSYMKITQRQLRQLIREEVERAYLEEGLWDDVKGMFKGKKGKEDEKEKEPAKKGGHPLIKKLDMYIDAYKKMTGTDDVFGQSFVDFAKPTGSFKDLRQAKGGDKLYSDIKDQITSFLTKRNEMAGAITKNLEAAKEKLQSPEMAKKVSTDYIEGEFNPYAKGPFESRRRRGKMI